MKIIKRTADNVVLFAGETLTLDEHCATGPFGVAKFVTSADAVVETVAQLPADFAGGCYTYAGGSWAVVAELQAQFTAAASAQLQAAIGTLVQRIDADVDAIYGAVLGNRAEEYVRAEQHALDYRAAGFTGPVPSGVASWSTANVATPQWAAEDIIATASAWRAAQEVIRAQRLLRKVQARAAVDLDALVPISAQWAGFVSIIRAQLDLPPA